MTKFEKDLTKVFEVELVLNVPNQEGKKLEFNEQERVK